jgi:IS6 family transposase
MRGLKRLQSVQTISAGHAFVQNLQRGHNELATETEGHLRLATAFSELARAV